MQSAETSEQVYSVLEDDPDLAVQVGQFVAMLPRLLATLHDCADRADWRALECGAHQIRGSSGCYGFDEVSSRAARLEDACHGQGEKEMLAALADLARLCDCVRSKQRPK